MIEILTLKFVKDNIYSFAAIMTKRKNEIMPLSLKISRRILIFKSWLKGIFYIFPHVMINKKKENFNKK